MRVIGTKLVTNRRLQDQGQRARPPCLSGALSVVGALLLLSCSGQSPDAGSGPPPTSSLKKVGAAVEQAKVLHWSGSWQYDDWFPEGSAALTSTHVTADLRAMGNGDAFGTVTADDHKAQVVSVAGAAMFVKADRVMLQMMGVEEPKAHVGRWTEIRRSAGTRQVLGLNLDWLAPSPLASSLASAAKATGGAKGGTSSVPSSAAERFPRPDRVPAGAAPVAVVGNESTKSGMYWVTASEPHQLVGYSGLDALHDSDGQPDESGFDPVAKLSVRTENAATARGTYEAMHTAIRSLPSVVPISAELAPKEVSETVDEECGVLCQTVTVTVSLTNRMPYESVAARYALALEALLHKDQDGYRLGNPRSVDIGSCTVRLPTAKPGTTVRAACTMGGPALRKAVQVASDQHGFVQMTLQTDATREVTRITGPSNSTDLLQKLDSHSDHVLGRN